jgi:ABC-type transport system involved in multi-copper enzyme maturation permease subunit
MTVLPIIGRELRAQSQLAFTYNLRVLGAAAVMLACLLYSLSHPLVHALGGELFSRLNFTVFVSIWILVPLLCSDCISRERREGTIGLLFLTPLSARDVVLAKGLVHGLRAFSLLLTALPVITIALFLGGVAWSDAALSLMMNFSSLCWALAAGLLASSFSKSWLRAQLLALGFTVCLGAGFLLLNGGNIYLFAGGGMWSPGGTADSLSWTVLFGFLDATNANGWWGRIHSMMPPARHLVWLLIHLRMVIVSILVLFLSIEIAARNLRRYWREEPPSARQVWIEKKLFTPILMVSFLRTWMRRKLERNPIGWLEQRSWSGRLVTWGWFAVMISIYSAAFNNTDVSRSLDILQKFMAWLLLGIMSVTAAGSFQRERETGVLELLLVSPMSVGQIIGGRLRGLWGQFLPAFFVLLGIWFYLSSVFPAERAARGLIEFFCGSFLAMPVIGLYYSLRRSNFVSAFLSTILLGVAIPFGLQLILKTGVQFVLGGNAYFLRGFGQPGSADSLSTLLFYALLHLILSPFFVTVVQLAVAAGVGHRLYHDMERRNFTFSRAVT